MPDRDPPEPPAVEGAPGPVAAAAGRGRRVPPRPHEDALDIDGIESWLREEDEDRLQGLWRAADDTRARRVGPQVHLRGLVEISNHCARACTYCGISAPNRTVRRYRMPAATILDCARQASAFGYGTLVMQAGEDYGLTTGWVADLVSEIKDETGLAITLSLGERPEKDLIAWHGAGADRYLLRFETSDEALYRRIHPGLRGRVSDRLAILRTLQRIGYEAGTGIMVGIPGQTYRSAADDIELFRGMDMDMIGIGPYLPHPATVLGCEFQRRTRDHDWPPDQVPNTELMTCKVIALTRLVRPDANLPATTALSLLDTRAGRAHGLQRGANVVMPNLTPLEYRVKYEIYPEKAAVHETAEAINASILDLLASLGRTIGRGAGGRGTAPHPR
ncbi:MAG: [FeFe] hydrogenase H-cluster radical SAM maturase HydE [Actinobacteria bacterium]|nr:[FeFe] hydrogenase H-cluster radical SAM maturase HydE [Actinomycetota bacterium]